MENKDPMKADIKAVPQALKRPCKNMGSETSKEVLKIRHKDKMEIKRRLRALPQGEYSPKATANVGKSHPDYGASPKDHMVAKRNRSLGN